MSSTNNANGNMYRVGDHVYFEAVASGPYHIRKIDELSQSSNGNVEARVTIFLRKRDLPLHVVQSLDRDQFDRETDSENNDCSSNVSSESMTTRYRFNNSRLPKLTSEQQEHIKLCEVFATSTQEILQVTHVRGKCHVVALEEEIENRAEFVGRENTFFYVRKYDPDKKVLRPPGEKIRVGVRWQANIPDFSPDDIDNEDGRVYEIPVFLASRISGKGSIVDDFLTIACAVGLYARSRNTPSILRDSCLLSTAARACRAVTKDKAFSILHDNDYDLAKAVSAIVSDGKLLLCCDELEDWTAKDATIFTQAIEKYGKAFSFMKRSMFAHKELSDIVGFYYFWKTTDHYAQLSQKQAATKTETKLKQVFIPQYNRINPSVLYTKVDPEQRSCDSCNVSTSPNWFAWGNPEDPCKLCRECWNYFKKYGGLPVKHDSSVKIPSELSLLNDKGDHDSAVNQPHVNGKIGNEMNAGSGEKSAAFPCPCCKLVLRSKNVLSRHILMVHPEFGSPQVNSSNSAVSNGIHTKPGICSSPLPNTKPSTASINFFSFPWLRLGKRIAISNRNSWRRVGRRPFINLEHEAGMSLKTCSEKGLELMKTSKSCETLSYQPRSSSLSICNRLMSILNMSPLYTRVEDLFDCGENQHESLKRVLRERISSKTLGVHGCHNVSSDSRSPSPHSESKRARLETGCPGEFSAVM